jgi:hypothetical protein
MSGMSPGTRVLASFAGSGLAPATVVEANPVTGLLKIRFDDGREAWMSQMSVRAAPNQAAAPPVQSGFTAAAPATNSMGFGATSFTSIAAGGMVGGKPFEGLNPFAKNAPAMQPPMQPGYTGAAVAQGGIATFQPTPQSAPMPPPVRVAPPVQPPVYTAPPAQVAPADGGVVVPEFKPFKPVQAGEAAPVVAPQVSPPQIPIPAFNPFAQGATAPAPTPAPTVQIPTPAFNPFERAAPPPQSGNTVQGVAPTTEFNPFAPAQSPPPGAQQAAPPFNPFAPASPAEAPAEFNPFAPPGQKS